MRYPLMYISSFCSSPAAQPRERLSFAGGRGRTSSGGQNQGRQDNSRGREQRGRQHNYQDNRQEQRQRPRQSGMPFQEALDIFGLQHDFTEEELKRRYHVLMSKIHPDHEGSKRIAQLVIEAHEVLKSHAKKG
jgi:hypothetical protein